MNFSYLCHYGYDTLFMKTFGIAAVAAALFSCCMMNAKEPAFKGTEWVFIEKRDTHYLVLAIFFRNFAG